MHKNPKTKNWEDDFRRGDLRWHVSYGTPRKAEASLLAAAALKLVQSKDTVTIDAIRRGDLTIQQVARLQDEGKPMTQAVALGAWPSVRVAVDDYLDWINENPKKAEGTYAAANTQLKRFVAWLGDDANLPLDEIPTKRVTEYQSSLLAAGAATNTVTAYVWRVGTVFRWHRDTELRDAAEAKRPARALHVPLDPHSVSTAKTHRSRFLSEGEAERLLAAAPDALLCPIAIGLFAGLRVDEVLHLRPAFDVDLELGLLTVQPQPTWKPKSGKRRDVPIAPPLRPLLEAHLERYASEDWLTPAMRDASLPFNRHTFDLQFKLVVGNAELVQGRKDPRGVVFHTLRHTFASWLVMRGVDLYTIAQLLGNSLKMVESTYGHMSPDFRQRAVDRLKGVVAVPALPLQSEPADAIAASGEESATTTATTDGKLCPV